MGSNKSLLFCLFCWCCCFSLSAQVEESMPQERVEEWAEQQEGGLDYLDLLEQLQFSNRRKLNLNRAQYEDLARLQCLSHSQIVALLEHKSRYGPFVSVYELQVVEGLSKELIRVLMQIVGVPESPFDWFRYEGLLDEKWKGETVLLLARRWEKSQGFLSDALGNTAFEGSPERWVLRQRFTYKNRLFLGYNGEKDAGEAFLRGANPRGFDFNSAHLFLKNSDKSVLRNLAIGDYQAEFGQGLAFSSGLGFGKSPGLFAIKRNRFGLRPYRSLNEAAFLRGMGAHLAWKNWQLIGFASQLRVDARLALNTQNDSLDIASLPLSGLHRTSAEIATKRQVVQRLVGAALHYQKDNFSLTYTFALSDFSIPFRTPSQVYQVWNAPTSRVFQQGLSYQWVRGNWVLFGEIAANEGGKHVSTVQGALLSLGKKMDLLYYYRDLHKAYNSVFTNPVTEFSNNRNERGMMMGLSVKPKYKWQLNTYLDRFYSEWLRYRVDAPSQGLDYLAELSYTERKAWMFYLRFRTKIKEWNALPSGAKTHQLEAHQRHVLRLHAQFTPHLEWTLRMRAEWVSYVKEGVQAGSTQQKGALVFVDVKRALPQWRSSVTGRLQFFAVDDYNARVYAFENDVFYSFTIPAFQHTGWRYYWVSKTVIKRRWTLWLRWAQTHYLNQTVQGSGNDRIESARITDFKVQVRYAF